MKRFASMLAIATMLAIALALAGCAAGASSSASSESASAAGSSEGASADAGSMASQSAALANGEYSAAFNTDSSMFHVNEADDGQGVLTVSDGGMTIYVHLVSKKITNLYVGKAADAEVDEANWLQPMADTVTYSDGITEEVYGFDIPVPAIGEEFDVAILGEKGTWYDHEVSVTDPVAL